MAKILITGINGFTGRHLANELDRAGHTVCGIAQAPVEDFPWQVHSCNLLDRPTLVDVFARERPLAVVHLAAIAFVAHGDAAAVYQTNIVGMRNVLDALVAADIRPKSVLLASSANVYGNAACEVLDETVPPAPANVESTRSFEIRVRPRRWCRLKYARRSRAAMRACSDRRHRR